MSSPGDRASRACLARRLHGHRAWTAGWSEILHQSPLATGSGLSFNISIHRRLRTAAGGVLASEALLYSAPRDGTAKALALCVGGEKWISSADISADEEWALDRSTGLLGQRGASLTTFSWSDALAYCEKLNLADYTDWRLPSVKELLSIVDDPQSGPAIDREAFRREPQLATTRARGGRLRSNGYLAAMLARACAMRGGALGRAYIRSI
ncbi:DUF1566 domain-containing protein [Sorangium cellulosum]|uniref:Lcl C-terminal domain-containing protein n=1 Tax=Sorangium cellulosum TaxID=56 RepID=UPI0009B84F27|nr:DUF1566 domain-containing protein [Sorangium cellulosum]